MKSVARLRDFLFAASLLAALCAPEPSRAGEFGISPMRLALGARLPIGAFTVRNADKVPLSFQVHALRWTQDEQGQEVFQDADDLVYFPRVLTVPPGQQAVIRVGLRQALVPTEKSYRLFIEELPPPAQADDGGGAKIRVRLRFGAPVFVQPPKPVYQLELPTAELADGSVHWRVLNTGNTHQRVESILLQGVDASGQEIVHQQFQDRYLLAGQARAFSLAIPRPDCERLAHLRVLVKTDQTEVRQAVAFGASPCQ